MLSASNSLCNRLLKDACCSDSGMKCRPITALWHEYCEQNENEIGTEISGVRCSPVLYYIPFISYSTITSSKKIVTEVLVFYSDKYYHLYSVFIMSQVNPFEMGKVAVKHC